MKSITTSLMFIGDQSKKAEEAIRFYTSLFPNSKIADIQRYQAGEHEPEGSTRMARFSINGTELMAQHYAAFGCRKLASSRRCLRCWASVTPGLHRHRAGQPAPVSYEFNGQVSEEEKDE
ncbi:MAG: VOC family protein [Pseudomonadales bacterium]